ncbi:hypothetical protein RUM44_011131 [Polyplax serrata]|uniref:Cyclic nucleotide-binding domain-containing protein n=1 Tax=Polyplax serrata TaxID=468196 RepID=A0ABR1APU1_POLSC
MDEITCVYPKHNCELRTQQTGRKPFCKKFTGFFKDMTMISQRNIRAHWNLRCTGSIHLEMTRQRMSKDWAIVHPFSQLRFAWEMFMCCVLFISIVFVPFKSGFLNPLVAKYYLSVDRSVRNIRIAMIIDFTLSCIWMVDTFANFFTGYFDWTSRKTIMDRKTITKTYLARGFYLDVTSFWPVESIYMFIFGLDKLAKMNQIAFIFLQFYIVYSTVRYRHYIMFCLKVGRLGNFYHLTVRLIFAFVVYFWVINWSVYLSLAVPQMLYGECIFRAPKKEAVSWVQVHKLFQKDLVEQYKTALVKSLYTNIGVSTWDDLFGVDDYILAIIICISGRLYCICFLVWFLETVTAATVLRVKFLLILEQLKMYMKRKEVPMFLKKRLNRFYFYRFQAHYFRNRAILGKLTESLRKEISMYACQKLINNTAVFQSLPRRVVARLVQRMNREMYFPNDVILRANTFGECMYFICSGTVAVWTVHDKEICRLEDGDFFGEIALIDENRRRTATITAVTITEVYRMEVSEYKKVIQIYPDVFDRLEKFAKKRIKMLVSVEGKSTF